MSSENNDIFINENKVKDGQYKCPNCGASEIQPNPKTGKLRCNYCFSEFDGDDLKSKVKDIKKLKGRIRHAGTGDIKESANDVVTLKCGGCGAEVVIDTKNAPHARCHWCRSILSINNKLENGAIPDVILPFKTNKDDARIKIEDFVKKRRFYANPTFKKEFTTENIMGVYFPYMLVDANCHANFSGVGEHLVKEYTVGSGDNKETVYVSDSYEVGREFDITIEGLSLESNSTRLDKNDSNQTNNIINSIMPFDTENCIEYKSNYLVGYTSERRDVNVDDLDVKVEKQLKDIARHSIKEDIKFYDRGVNWKKEDFNIIGTQWLSAYLPVWLYSYLEVKGNKKVLHYVAVNARTNETMGSVPINMPLLIVVSVIIEFLLGSLGIFLFIVTSSGDDDDNTFFLALLLSGFIYYGIMYARYRNKDARHVYENETKHTVENIKRYDNLLNKGIKSNNPDIENRNDSKIEGESIKIKKGD